MGFLRAKGKGQFFTAVALLVMALGGVPGTLVTQWLRPPRRGADGLSGGQTLLYAAAAIVAGAGLLAIAHRAPPDKKFLGEDRKSWLMLLYTCLAGGLAAGIAFVVYLG